MLGCGRLVAQDIISDIVIYITLFCTSVFGFLNFFISLYN